VQFRPLLVKWSMPSMPNPFICASWELGCWRLCMHCRIYS
jgi:hypothetical protein